MKRDVCKLSSARGKDRRLPSRSLDAPSDLLKRLMLMIRQRRLKSGDQLPTIKELADLWRVNASLVRSGLLRAQTLGLVEIRPRSGAFVRDFAYDQAMDLFACIFDMTIHHSAPRLLDLYEARRVLESHIFRTVAEKGTTEDFFQMAQALDRLAAAPHRAGEIRADEEFHLLAARAAGNPVLARILEVLLGMMRPDRELYRPSARERRDTWQSHRQLLLALQKRDAELAQRLAAQHISNRRQSLERIINRLTHPEGLQPAANRKRPGAGLP